LLDKSSPKAIASGRIKVLWLNGPSVYMNLALCPFVYMSLVDFWCTSCESLGVDRRL
jgi:hypothetical protein